MHINEVFTNLDKIFQAVEYKAFEILSLGIFQQLLYIHLISI